MTAESKIGYNPVRRNILILGGLPLIGSVLGLDAWIAWHLLDNIIPQDYEGGKANPGHMAKIIWGENCIYGFQTWADNFEGRFGGSMIYFSKLKRGEWLYTNVIEMSPDSSGGRPEISILDATKGESGAAYFMGTTSAPVDYVDKKEGLVKDSSKIFVWGALRGSTKIRFVTDFEGESPTENRKLFLDFVKTYDRSIHFD